MISINMNKYTKNRRDYDQSQRSYIKEIQCKSKDSVKIIIYMIHIWLSLKFSIPFKFDISDMSNSDSKTLAKGLICLVGGSYDHNHILENMWSIFE